MEKPDFGHFSIFKPPKHTVKIILAKNEYQIRNPLIFLHILGTHVVADEQKKIGFIVGFQNFYLATNTLIVRKQAIADSHIPMADEE